MHTLAERKDFFWLAFVARDIFVEPHAWNLLSAMSTLQRQTGVSAVTFTAFEGAHLGSYAGLLLQKKHPYYFAKFAANGGFHC